MDRSSDTKTYLATLRTEHLQPEALARVAADATPLLCCSATLHPEADQSVYHAAAMRDDLPVWARIGLALHCAEPALIDDFITSKNKDLQLAVSDNPHLSEFQALALIAESDDTEVWARLGCRYLDSVTVLDALTSQKGRNSAWQSRVKSLRNPATAGKRLQNLLWDMEPRSEFVARLIARHPKCPLDLLKMLAFYLPEDVAQNPTYQQKLQNAPHTVEPAPFSKKRTNDFLNGAYAPEFLLNWVMDNDPELKNLRRCIHAPAVNPNKVRWLAVSGDANTQRKFVDWLGKRDYSEYEYHMLALTGSPSVKKALLERNVVSDALLIELVNDRAGAVRVLAREFAERRNLKIPLTKTRQKAPSKAERIEVAEKSTDPDELGKLANDRTKDVRAIVASNENTPVEALKELVLDADDSVCSHALRTLQDAPAVELEALAFQQQLQELAMNNQRIDQVRILAFYLLRDTSCLATLYTGSGSKLDCKVLQYCSDPNFIDQVLVLIRDGENPEVARNLAYNGHATLKQKLSFPVKLYPKLLTDLLLNTKDKAEIMTLCLKFREAVSEDPGIAGTEYAISHLKPEFSPCEILELYEQLEPFAFYQLAGRVLHTLSAEKAIPILKNLVRCERPTKGIADNPSYCLEVSNALRDMLVEAEEWYTLGDLFSHYQQPENVIEALLERPDTTLHRFIAKTQELSDAQVTQLLGSRDWLVRQALARYQNLTDKQLDALCRDLEIRVIMELFKSETICCDRLPTWVICRALSPGYCGELDEKALSLLKQRGIRHDMAYLEQTSALELFDISISTRKFNQLLAEHDIIELADGHNSYGQPVRIKRFARRSRHFGFNLSEKEWVFEPQFFPATFPELLEELGLSTAT